MNYNQYNRYKKSFSDNINILDWDKFIDEYTFITSGSTFNIYTITINVKKREIYCNCLDLNRH